MLTFSRQLAKQIRSVFRRALQISASQTDQTVWLVADDTGLRVRAQNERAIIEYHLPSVVTPDSISITMEALAACEGTKTVESVSVERLADETVVLRWDNHSIPQSFQLDAKKLHAAPAPALPETWMSNPPRLLTALSDAMKIVPTDATRFAINCVHLRPNGGRIAATDSHQLLIEFGFAFHGEGDVLIPRTMLFGSRELPTDQPVDVGLTDNHCVFRMGPWTIWLSREKQDRYPRVEDIIPTADSAKTRLSLSADDVPFLLEVVPRLPAETDQQGRVTLDLNGHVALLAKGDGPSPVTQVVLRNSHRSGDEVRLNTDRQFLVRAAQLGFQAIELHGTESPVVCRDEHRVYLWSVLAEMPVLTVGPDTVQLESPLITTHQPARSVSPARRTRQTKERTSTPMPHNRVAATLAASAASPENGSVSPPTNHNNDHDNGGSFNAILQQAESVKTTLRQAHTEVGGLVSRLKRYRQQSKFMQATLASLKQLQSLEV